MEFFEMTSQGTQEPGVKQERDTTENEASEMIHQQNPSNDEGNGILMKGIKCEVASDDDNDNIQMSDNIESHNSQMLFKSECKNVYDDMLKIELNEVKIEYPEILDSVGDKTAPGTLNDDQMNQDSSDEDVHLRRLGSRKRGKLSEDTSSGLGLKERRSIKSEEQRERGNTDPADPAAAATLRVQHEGNIFSCHQCHYSTTNKYRLNAHLKIHTGEKPFSCDKCDYKCIKKSNLNNHILTHTGEKPFSCNKCDYKCKFKSLLKAHLVTHTKGKPISCEMCHYKCRTKSHLNLHLLTHTGEKPFSCNQCDYKCIKKSIFKNHILTHNGEKRFLCYKCDYKCIKKSNLKNHIILTHTDEKPFSCNQCDYKCKNKRKLKSHIMTHTDKKS